MSSTCSAASAVLASGLSEPECEPLHSARSIRSVDASSPSTGQMFPSMTTCEPSQATDCEQMELPLMSSAAGSPARTSASPDAAPASRASTAVYGRSTPELLANYDPSTQSWRTSQRCLIEGWALFSETWPRSGLMQSGIAYLLPPLVPRIIETGSGLWPTPTAGDSKASGSRNTPNSKAHPGISLTDAVRMDGGRGRMWPTPAARDYRYPNATPYSARGGGLKGEQLPNAAGGPLNPAWVEWLMGFPLGWTDCTASATPSSRKSPRSSGEQS